MPIIVVTGKEIEKIKGDFESYLNGMNMVGEILYSQYSELYDEGTKQIQKAYELGKSELGKENAELTEQNTSLLTSVENLNKSVQELEKENAELKDDIKARKFAMAMSEKVEKKLRQENKKAKEIIRTFLNMPMPNNEEVFADVGAFLTKVEQFLKDSEVEK